MHTQCSGSPMVCNCVSGYYDSNGDDQAGGTCIPSIKTAHFCICSYLNMKIVFLFELAFEINEYV